MRPALLFLCAFVPSRTQAGHNFTRLLIDDLSASYDIDLVYFRYANEQDYAPKRSGVRVVARFITRKIDKILNVLRHPLTFPQFSVRHSPRHVDQIRRAIAGRHYDAVYIDHSQMFLYSGMFDRTVKLVLMSHDLQVQRFSRSYGRLASWLCARTERRFLTLPNAHVLTFSQKDSDIAHRVYGVVATHVGFYIDDCVRTASPKTSDDYFVLFAAWNRRENVEGLRWFVHKVMPMLKKRPRVRIIGGGMPSELKAALSAVRGIECLGFVDDPYPVIASAKALLAPLFKGAGVKVKVVESLSVGTAVIGTDVAFEGLSGSFENAMICCSTPGEFASAISSFAMELGDKTALKARFLFEYSGRTAGQIIKSLISGV